MVLFLIKILILTLILLFGIIEGKSRRRLMRVGVRPDPPLDPFTNTSSLYISYTNFLRGFINTQGLFNRTAPIPSNLTYASFMDTAVSVGFIPNKNDLSAFMASVLVASNGLTQIKENNTSIVDEFTRTFYRRGYLGIKGMEEYKEASMELFQDQRLLEAPELVIQSEETNWKVSLWKWNKSLTKQMDQGASIFQRFPEIVGDLLGAKRCEVVHRVYMILKREWDPKSEPFRNCLIKI